MGKECLRHWVTGSIGTASKASFPLRSETHLIRSCRKTDNGTRRLRKSTLVSALAFVFEVMLTCYRQPAVLRYIAPFIRISSLF